MVVVSLSLATICFLGQCHHALVGRDTPKGVFHLEHMATNQKGYGGDILMYDQNKTYAWAIHRLWLEDPQQHRRERIESDNPQERVITMGCINVNVNVYKELVSCCSSDTLKITN
jgi:hypothetical protein